MVRIKNKYGLIFIIPILTLTACEEKTYTISDFETNKTLFYDWQKKCKNGNVQSEAERRSCVNFNNAAFQIYNRHSETGLEKIKVSFNKNDYEKIARKSRELNKVWGDKELKNPYSD